MSEEPPQRTPKDSSATRKSLIESAKLGNPAAWTALHERYRGLICRNLAGMGIPDHAIADVVQNVLIALWKGALQRFDWRSRFSTFLFRCVRYAGLKWLRDEKRRGKWIAPDNTDGEHLDESMLLPDEAWDDEFDRTTVESAVDAVRAEFESRGEVGLFEALFECLDKSRRPLREATAQQLDFASARIRTRISRLRKAIRGAIRQHIYDVIPDPAEAEAEYLRLARPYLG